MYCVKEQALLFSGIRCFTEVELQVLDHTSIFTTPQPITGIVLQASLLHSTFKARELKSSLRYLLGQCTMNSRSPCPFKGINNVWGNLENVLVMEVTIYCSKFVVV